MSYSGTPDPSGYTSTAIDYTQVSTDRVINVTAVPHAVTLLAPSLGRKLEIKAPSTATVSSPVTVTAAASTTIDGAATFLLTQPNQSVSLYGVSATAWIVY